MLKNQSKNFKKLSLSNAKLAPNVVNISKQLSALSLKSPASPLTRTRLPTTPTLSQARFSSTTTPINQEIFSKEPASPTARDKVEELVPVTEAAEIAESAEEVLPAADALARLESILVAKTVDSRPFVQTVEFKDEYFQTLKARSQVVNGDTFESYWNQVFTLLGFKPKHVGGSGDSGVDLLFTYNGSDYIVQSKFTSPGQDGVLGSKLDKDVVSNLLSSYQLSKKCGINPIIILVESTPFDPKRSDVFERLEVPALHIYMNALTKEYSQMVKSGGKQVPAFDRSSFAIHANKAMNDMLPEELKKRTSLISSIGIDVSNFANESFEQVVSHVGNMIRKNTSLKNFYGKNGLIFDEAQLQDFQLIKQDDKLLLKVPVFVSSSLGLQEKRDVRNAVDAIFTKAGVKALAGVQIVSELKKGPAKGLAQISIS